MYRTLTKLVDAGLLREIEIGHRTVYDHDYGYPHTTTWSASSATR